MREKIKCLDGPMEGEEVYLDRRLMLMYDQTVIEQDNSTVQTGHDVKRYVYEIRSEGLKFIRNA